MAEEVTFITEIDEETGKIFAADTPAQLEVQKRLFALRKKER